MPGLQVSVHITLYLPTCNKDTEFMADLAELRNCLDKLTERFPDLLLYLRGDGNVNSNNTKRVILLQHLMRDYNLVQTEIEHSTYHHFMGDGLYDSSIDILLHSDSQGVSESIAEIQCKLRNPAVLSHHDIIISSFTVPAQAIPPSTSHAIAPKIDHIRTRIEWSEEGAFEYSKLIQPCLRQARDLWLNPSSQTSMSMLLSVTSSILTRCAEMTNKCRVVGNKAVIKSRKVPKAVRLAANKVAKANRMFRFTSNVTCPEQQKLLKSNLINTKKKLRKTVRQQRIKDSLQRYSKLDQIFGNSASAFAYIKSCRKSKPRSIERLTVGDKVYLGQAVCDGFYYSMTGIKQCDLDNLRKDSNLSNQFINYDSILHLCKTGPPIPAISSEKSAKILKSLKRNVTDLYSVTALHYLNAGQEGLRHYNCLLNALISEINNAKVEEMNTAHGVILYKGHRKDRTSDRSYRTISSCPFLAKSVDFYLRDQYQDCWNSCQASTQYQGSGSSHEIASLLVTEVLQFSLHVSNKPVFLLALDAQSAFDRCLRQILCSELFKAGVNRSAILFMDNRLANRKTVYEWEGHSMGPASDITGFEQGGVNSSDYYKLYNNEQLITAQSSQLGVDIGSGVISAVGQADDVLLMSNDLYSLQLLVRLTEEYCLKYRVQLEPKKTKLLGYSSKSSELLMKIKSMTSTITINNVKVGFSKEAEHVGVVRSTDGNMPSILQRVAQHKKSLGSVLGAGLARGHRGSPAAALRVHLLHCAPVLFSGLASLVLSRAEIKIIDKHYQYTLQNLQKLHMKTPRSIIFFLAGMLPGEAMLHIRQLTLFSMICHLPNDPLHHHALYTLSYLPASSKSWFLQVKDICLQYDLPHPMTLLQQPLPKVRFKRLVKLKVTEYWQHTLAAECSSPEMTSLRYFNPHFASLQKPHPMWTSAAGHSFESTKSIVLAKMVSGRYRTEMMCRFWSQNKFGFCLFDTCKEVCEDLEHMLIVCPAHHAVRERLHSLWYQKAKDCQPFLCLVMRVLGSTPETQVKFILDSKAFPEIIYLKQKYGREIEDRVMYMTRTWAFAIHRHRLKCLDRWPGSGHRIKNNSKSNFSNTQSSIAGFTMGQESVSAPSTGFSTTLVCPMSSMTTPSTSSPYLVAGTSSQALTIAASYSGSLACSNILSQQDQLPVPVVAQAPGSNIVHHQPVSSSVGIIGDQLGGGEGHVAAGCGSGAWAS